MNFLSGNLTTLGLATFNSSRLFPTNTFLKEQADVAA
jgi:hypothetical protein